MKVVSLKAAVLRRLCLRGFPGGAAGRHPSRPLARMRLAAKPLRSFSAFVITAVPILSLWCEGYR
jgi:hypothetical protein